MSFAIVRIDTAGLRTPTIPPDAMPSPSVGSTPPGCAPRRSGQQRGSELGEARGASADVVVLVNDDVAAWDDGARFADRAAVFRCKADLGGEAGAGW